MAASPSTDWISLLGGVLLGLLLGVRLGRRFPRRSDVMEALNRMGTQEVGELVRALEARWGVSAVPPRVQVTSANDNQSSENDGTRS